jgi:hypothetical protein
MHDMLPLPAPTPASPPSVGIAQELPLLVHGGAPPVTPEAAPPFVPELLAESVPELIPSIAPVPLPALLELLPAV